MGILGKFEEEKKISKKDYYKDLQKYQLRLSILQRELRTREIPLILAFEGWDASGKGGAIKRVTEKLDPRGLKVYPVGAPSGDEIKRHYLWRFWSRLPRKGEIVIFDRTWYGRVMVERVEGFATEYEWKRAYHEINEFEKTLINDDTILCKFFMHISKDEQLRRFTDRQDDPFKSWKITAEDWRNREKWELYEAAVEEMISKTDTKASPWHVICGVNKRMARIEVLKAITHTIEDFCKIDKELLYQQELAQKH
ncbi:MAG: polyphosphate kinase 2 family protein [Vampirovibrionia bacterium]